MTAFSNRGQVSSSIRQLRRLDNPSVVTTSYDHRNVEEESNKALERYESAWKQGYEDGYAEGLAKAEAASSAQREEELQRVESAIAALKVAARALSDEDQKSRQDISATLPRLAFSLVEEILKRELSVSVNPGKEAIARALLIDQGSQPVMVRLNPRDFAVLGDISELACDREIDLVADSTVEPAGAVLDIGKSTIDAQLGTALERVKNVLYSEKKYSKSND